MDIVGRSFSFITSGRYRVKVHVDGCALSRVIRKSCLLLKFLAWLPFVYLFVNFSRYFGQETGQNSQKLKKNLFCQQKQTIRLQKKFRLVCHCLERRRGNKHRRQVSPEMIRSTKKLINKLTWLLCFCGWCGFPFFCGTLRRRGVVGCFWCRLWCLCGRGRHSVRCSRWWHYNSGRTLSQSFCKPIVRFEKDEEEEEEKEEAVVHVHNTWLFLRDMC